MIRESASAGVIWKCWSNISFRLDSAILLSASRRLPLYPKPSARFRGGWRWRWWWARELLVNGETADRGLKRPIEDLQTRCHPLSPASSLHNLLFPSNLPQPRSTILHVLVHPRPSPSSISANVPTGLPCPTADLARWRTALQNRAKCKTSKIRGLKFQFAVTTRTSLKSLQSHICVLSRDLL